MKEQNHEDYIRQDMENWFKTEGDLDDFIFYWDTVNQSKVISQTQVPSEEQC